VGSMRFKDSVADSFIRFLDSVSSGGVGSLCRLIEVVVEAK